MPTVEPIPTGALLIDCDTKLSLAMCKAIASAVDARGRPLGIRGVIRYLSLGSPSRQDLDATETTDIHAAGLSLMAVQHVRNPGWIPSQPLGAQDGASCNANAHHALLLPGCSIGLDLEGVSPTAAPGVVSSYASAWYRAMSTYLPPLYVGADSLLTGPQLFALPFTRYWRSESVVPTPLPRGFSLYQMFSSQKLVTSAGTLDVDYDFACEDWRGDTCNWQCP